MAAREEQETVVTMGRVDEHMNIWTNNIVHVRALEKEDRAVRVNPGPEMSEDDFALLIEAGFGAEYHVKAADARILNVFARKVKPMSEERRKATAERLAAARAAK